MRCCAAAERSPSKSSGPVSVSDIDLLVELPAGMGLFAIAKIQNELEELLGSPVDLIPRSGLKAGVRPAVPTDLVHL